MNGLKAIRVSVLWLLLALAALTVLLFRLQLTFDLSAFLPQKASLMQEILLEQLKNGPGSRLIVIGLKGLPEDQLADYSDMLKSGLSGDPGFVNVLNGEFSLEVAIPEPVQSYFLLLDDIDYSEKSIRQALLQRQRDLNLLGGNVLLDMIARDPFLNTLKILERLRPVNTSDEMWFAKDGSAVLLAETRAPAIDIAAQEQAMKTVKRAVTSLPGSDALKLELTGVGAFSVELQSTIRAEAQRRSIMSITALLTVLLVLYRSLKLLLLAALPVGVGFLVGLATVAAVFDSVHGITLAFGFTLMGVAIDYPLHLFSHARSRSGATAIQLIWPTLRIGAASTAIAYLAIAISGSAGLAQLGIFTASGVIVAALATRYWLPLFIAGGEGAETGSAIGPRQPVLTFLPVVVILLLALAGTRFLPGHGIWDDRLTSLSPVPEDRLMTDGLLRSAAGTPDMRYQLVQHQADLETLLHESELLDLQLQKAVDDGLLQAWQSASLVLPSRSIQQKRQDAIPDDDTLHARLIKAVAETAFREDAFEPFEKNAISAKNLPLLTPERFRGTPLASWLDSHLIQAGGQWVSLVSMSGLDAQALASRMRGWDSQTELVDLHQSSIELMRDYRNGALKTISIASLLIIALLLFEQKKARKVTWIVFTVCGSLAVTTVIVATLHSGLTIIHLVGLLLVMGLGLDYALFLSRTESGPEQAATGHAVVACALTTSLTFGILAASSIPVLKFLGLTVATGSAASFILAYAGSRLSRKNAQ